MTLAVAETLRALRREGRHASELMRYLDAQGLMSLEAMACLRDAFGISLLHASFVRAWDPSAGAAADAELDARLDPIIDAAGWTRLHTEVSDGH